MIFSAFFVATWLVLAISTYSAWRDFIRFGDLLGASQLLMIVLGYSIIYHDNMIWLVIVDFAAMLVSAFWYVSKRHKWAFSLVLTYTAQLAVHAWFWAFSDHSYYAQHAHVLLLNTLAVIQLLIIGWPGAKYVGSEISALLFGRGGRRVGLGSGALS